MVWPDRFTDLQIRKVLRWLHDIMEKMGGEVPTENEMKQFVWDLLNAGQIVPGFGHAVLRITDPRYIIQREFAQKHMNEDPIFKYVDILYKVVPPILIDRVRPKIPGPMLMPFRGDSMALWSYGI